MPKEDGRRMEEVFDKASIRGSWGGEKKTLKYLKYANRGAEMC